MSIEAFRQGVRGWLEENCPEAMRKPPTAEDPITRGGSHYPPATEDARTWLDRMAEKGWTTPIWPKECGGAGLSGPEAAVLDQELREIGARTPLGNMGIAMLGPVLLEFGSESQQREHLPRIASGEIAWCQGYSEPGSGSDLASLQTRATEEGDDFIVNGQKIWTSGADSADWIFCLVRTEPDADKHGGISFLLFDMTSPGVTVSPIKLISGSSPFCQTFFQDVRVPGRNLIGTRGAGWTIAKRLLQHERTMISGLGAPAPRTIPLPEQVSKSLGSGTDAITDPVLRDRVAQQESDALCYGLTVQRNADEAKAGGGPSHTASMFKYYATELNKRKFEILMSSRGSQGLGWEGDGFDEVELNDTRQWLRSKGNSIEGGTSEIQLNVIAKRVLVLPD